MCASFVQKLVQKYDKFDVFTNLRFLQIAKILHFATF
jgi:hypothetical protein